MKRATNAIVNRSRLVATCAAATVFIITTALAYAQEHAPESPSHSAHGQAATAGDDSSQSPGEEPRGGEHEAVSQADHGHAASGHHGPDDLNWTDIWDKRRPAILALVINFGVLMSLYYLLGKKPVAEALKQRRITVGKEIDEAQQLLAEAKQRAKKYQRDLKNVETDAAQAKAALIAAGKGEADQLLRDSVERSERMKRDAFRLVEQERKQQRNELLRETVELSVHEASRLLAGTITAEDHLRLAHDLLAELGRRPAASGNSGRAVGTIGDADRGAS